MNEHTPTKQPTPPRGWEYGTEQRTREERLRKIIIEKMQFLILGIGLTALTITAILGIIYAVVVGGFQ